MYARLRSVWSRRPRRTDPVLLAVLAAVVEVHALVSVASVGGVRLSEFWVRTFVAFALFAAALRWEWVLALPDNPSFPSEEALSSEVAHGLEQLEDHLRRSA